MRCTYFFLQATPGRSAAEVISAEMDQMVLSEDLGFDSVWLTEHHFSDYGLSAAPSVLAATLAARTTRIRIGTAVYVIPFHHPVRLAEETATLDILSGYAGFGATLTMPRTVVPLSETTSMISAAPLRAVSWFCSTSGDSRYTRSRISGSVSTWPRP
jgi:hypothetical protein